MFDVTAIFWYDMKILKKVFVYIVTFILYIVFISLLATYLAEWVFAFIIVVILTIYIVRNINYFRIYESEKQFIFILMIISIFEFGIVSEIVSESFSEYRFRLAKIYAYLIAYNIGYFFYLKYWKSN